MSRWSLERIGFVLGHLENFVGHASEDAELKERVRSFSPQTDLTGVEKLSTADPSDPRLPELVIERLAPFFDSGVLIRRAPDSESWTVTDLIGRGTTFHLAPEEQIEATSVIPEATPLVVGRAPAPEVLHALDLDFLTPSRDALAYLFRPTDSVCLVLVSDLAPVFAHDHVAAAQSLINASFLY